jgi:hypothetical protein
MGGKQGQRIRELRQGGSEKPVVNNNGNKRGTDEW